MYVSQDAVGSNKSGYDGERELEEVNILKAYVEIAGRDSSTHLDVASFLYKNPV